MGNVIGTKKGTDNKQIFTIVVDYKDSLQLQGRIDNIYVFCEDVAEVKSSLIVRGDSKKANYFCIPKRLRNELNIPEKIRCQKLETADKLMFIYILDKLEI